MLPNTHELIRLGPNLAHNVRDDVEAIRHAMGILSEDQSIPTGARGKIKFINEHLRAVVQRTRQFQIITNSEVQNPIDLRSVLSNLKPLLQQLLETCLLQMDIDPGLWPIRCDIGRFVELFIPLVVNAREAMPRSGTVRIHACNLLTEGLSRTLSDQCASPSEFILLEVTDEGIGMSSEVLDRIFDPFFSTKGAGCGFSLAQVRAQIQGLGGKIKVQSEMGNGTTVSMFLPRFTTEVHYDKSDA